MSTSKPLHAESDKHPVAWAFYDWGNSAFATVVLAGFFPIFMSDFWIGSDADVTSTKVLGLANVAAGLIVALIAPLLGAVADAGGSRKKFLFFFASLGVVMTAGLFWVEQGDWLMAVAFYVLAFIGFAGGNVFYDSLISDVSSDGREHFVSSLGYGLGYLGGGLMFSGLVYMVLNYEQFGFNNKADPVRWSFIITAVWWAVFAIPLFLKVKERKKAVLAPRGEVIISGLKQLRQTFREIRKLKVVFLFLLAYWLYIDGVHTMIIMAANYGKQLGFESSSLVSALLITQFIGFPSALLFGYLAQKTNPKLMIYIAISVYVGVAIYGMYLESIEQFYVMAGVIGLVQGGVQAISRSYYSRIIPRKKSAEFFGFYNMVGKFAAVLGPLLVVTVAELTGSERLSILAIAALFIAGGILLMFVREEAAAVNTGAGYVNK